MKTPKRSMIKWLGASVLGVIFWYVLTIFLGFIISLLFKDLSFFKSNSNLMNFILFPVGMWLGFKITKKSFFGFQTNNTPVTKLQNELLANELKIVVKKANELNKKERERVAINVMNQMATYVSEIEGLPKPSKEVEEICKRQLREAMRKRQNAITELEYKNPDWIQASLVESFLHCNSGFLEKKTYKIMMDLISGFIRENTKI
jgi:hypothetical protein